MRYIILTMLLLSSFIIRGENRDTVRSPMLIHPSDNSFFSDLKTSMKEGNFSLLIDHSEIIVTMIIDNNTIPADTNLISSTLLFKGLQDVVFSLSLSDVKAGCGKDTNTGDVIYLLQLTLSENKGMLYVIFYLRKGKIYKIYINSK